MNQLTDGLILAVTTRGQIVRLRDFTAGELHELAAAIHRIADGAVVPANAEARPPQETRDEQTP